MTRAARSIALLAAAVLGGCVTSAPQAAAPSGAAPRLDAVGRAPLLGEEIARREWLLAENKARCAPLALADDGGVGGEPRRATFSGGWAVAFDRPGQRSAYGFAGTGIDEGAQAFAVRRSALVAQWPYTWEATAARARLPAESFAGYGLEGAKPYGASEREGLGSQSLAYLVVPGEGCLYNVWSKLGRAHLETLLAGLVKVER